MEKQLLTLLEEALSRTRAAQNMEQLKEIRVAYLGKKGPITESLRQIGTFPQRKGLGWDSWPMMCAVKLQKLWSRKRRKLSAKLLEEQLRRESIDVTLPGRPVRVGVTHPLQAVIEEIEAIFLGMGFTIAEGPEVEADYYNFEALNIPKNHPPGICRILFISPKRFCYAPIPPRCR